MTNTQYYAAELMVYFEKHRFLDVIRALLVKLALDRPLCLKHYLRKNLRKIANSVLTRNTIVHLPLQFDVEHFVKTCLQMYNIPIITYNTRGHLIDAKKLKEIFRKFEKFCKKNGIQKKHKIYLNMPNNFGEVLQIENCESPPTNFIHVTTGDRMDSDFKDVLDFYGGTIKEVPIPNANDVNMEDSLVPEVMHKIKYSPISVPHEVGGHFVYRTIIMGRRGSGRKTQAKLLAARYNLVYINVESLIQQTMQSKDNMAKVLCVVFKKENKFSSSTITALLWRRILQNDALTNGWVIVGFPNCISELETVVEKFETPPNRIVMVHCSKNIALRRLIKQWESPLCPINRKLDSCAYVEKQFAQYDQNKVDMHEYLQASKTKTIHIDGSQSACSIKNKIFGLMER